MSKVSPVPSFALASGHDFEEKPWKEMTEDEQRAMAERHEAFDELPEHEQWEQAFAALKARGGGLELRPDSWKAFRFAHELSALDLMAEDWESRLDRAFPLDEQAA